MELYLHMYIGESKISGDKVTRKKRSRIIAKSKKKIISNCVM